MLPFRTEIRNTPREQTIKVYLSDCDMNEQLKERLTNLQGIESIEIQKSLARNRMSENITVFKTSNVNINELKQLIDVDLQNFYNEYCH